MNSKEWGTVNLKDSYTKFEEKYGVDMNDGGTLSKKNAKTKSIDFEHKEKYFYQPYF